MQDLENIPPPDEASGHAERVEIMDKVLKDTQLALIHVAMCYEIDTEAVTTFLDTLRPPIVVLMVTAGTSMSPYASRIE